MVFDAESRRRSKRPVAPDSPGVATPSALSTWSGVAITVNALVKRSGVGTVVSADAGVATSRVRAAAAAPPMVMVRIRFVCVIACALRGPRHPGRTPLLTGHTPGGRSAFIGGADPSRRT